MKISELQQIPQITRQIKVPVCIAGQNKHMTVGQLLDVMNATVVEFEELDDTDAPLIADGSTGTALPIVYHLPSGKFYARLVQTSEVSGIETTTTTLYTDWQQRAQFYSDYPAIRRDCTFVAADGRLYKYNGTALISAGLTDQQARQISLGTPIEMTSEDDMEALINSGDAIEGQIYFIAEEEN